MRNLPLAEIPKTAKLMKDAAIEPQ